MKNSTYYSYTQPHHRKQLEAKLFVTQGLKDLVKIVVLSLVVVVGGYMKANQQSESLVSMQTAVKKQSAPVPIKKPLPGEVAVEKIF